MIVIAMTTMKTVSKLKNNYDSRGPNDDGDGGGRRDEDSGSSDWLHSAYWYSFQVRFDWCGWNQGVRGSSEFLRAIPGRRTHPGAASAFRSDEVSTGPAQVSAQARCPNVQMYLRPLKISLL